MIRRLLGLTVVAVVIAAVTPNGAAAAEECELTPRTACFGLSSAGAHLSTAQAGAHPEVTLDFEVKQDPTSEENSAGFKAPFALTRNVRFELPPGLTGNPNAIGPQQQCSVQELVGEEKCPNGSQVGRTTVSVYGLGTFTEPLYMMKPPGGDVAAQLGFIAAIYPTLIDSKLRSESDYGLNAEVLDAIPSGGLVAARTTIWGVPASSVHDHERCTPIEVFEKSCTETPEARHPGSLELPFWTNPTRCGAPLNIRVAASSWSEPERFDTAESSMGQIVECNRLPFGPSLEVNPTSHRAISPTGANLTIKLPASEGVEVLEPSQMRSIDIRFPQGLAINTGSADGLATCSPAEVAIGTRESMHCPDAAKLASTEFEIPVLERRLKGAIYLREPVPGDPFRIWIVADDLGLHIKLPGELHVDTTTGRIESITLDPKAEAEGLIDTGGIPQAPVREVKLNLKPGFRAPLVNPPSCGEYRTEYEIFPWSGNPISPKLTDPFKIDEGCDTGGFAPHLSAGSVDARGGSFSPFVFKITREDSEQNISGLDITLPRGLVASFAGIPRCQGAAVESGACPAASRVGKAVAAVGAGPAPLWVPRSAPGDRPSAVYLGGPYKGAPLSIVTVVPKQAGPFDFGDEVVRSAVFVDPETAQATAKADPLPQFVEGIPLYYRTVFVELDRSGFTLNPTSCAQKETSAALTSVNGKVASATAPFRATECSRLPFRPRLSIRLIGSTHRGANPRLKAVLKARAGEADIGRSQVTLPASEFVDNEHFNNVCTRVQFAAGKCPPNSVYGFAVAKTPLFDFPLEGPVYLRTNPSRKLPDLLAVLRGPASMPIEVDLEGHVDSAASGALRTTFETVPDAPVTEFKLRVDGARKGLLVNSENLCLAKRIATAKFIAQNGKRKILHPVVKASCPRSHRHA